MSGYSMGPVEAGRRWPRLGTLVVVCALVAACSGGSGGRTGTGLGPVSPPTLSSVSPASGVEGTAVGVTLTGTNFVSGATVPVSGNGVNVSNVAVVSATSITATFTIGASATLGADSVRVLTAGGASGSQPFTVTAPPPTLSSVSPTSGARGTTVNVTLAGKNFIPGATVAASGAGIGVSDVVVASDSSITATFAIGASATVGVDSVTVTTTGGTSGSRAFSVTGGGGGATPSTIQVKPASPTIAVGATEQFTATAFDSAGDSLSGVTFTWSSSDSSVATIDSSGLATGVAAGSTHITARAQGVSSAADDLTVTGGGSSSFFYTGYDSNGDYQGHAANVGSSGILTLNSAGGVQLSQTKNTWYTPTQGQTITQAQLSADYQLGADRTLTITDPTSGTVLESGVLSPDGAAIVFNSVVAGPVVPQITVAVVQEGNGTDSDLHGTYDLVGYDDNGSVSGYPISAQVWILTATFDGAGNLTGSQIMNSWDPNSNTHVISNDTNLASTYSVASDGTLTIQTSNGPATGGVAPGGGAFVFGQNEAGEIPTIGVGVELDTGGSDADLSGTYVETSYNNDASSDTTSDNTGVLSTVTFDGSGAFSGTAIEKSWNGAANTGAIQSTAISGTYTVASDGTLTLRDSSGNVIATGGLEAGGDMFVLGAVGVGAVPKIIVGARK